MRILQLLGLLILLVAAGGILTGCDDGSGPVRTNSTPDFRVAVNPETLTINQGSEANYTVTVTAANGFSAGVTPTVSGLPTGANATFNPASVTPTAAGATTTLTITTTGTGGRATPAGSSTLTISAGAGAVSHQVTTSLVITVPTPGSLQGSVQ